MARFGRPTSRDSICVSSARTGPSSAKQTSSWCPNNAYRLRRIAGFGTRERMDQAVLGVTAVTVDRGGDLASLVAAEAAGRVTGSTATRSGPPRTCGSSPARRCSTSASTARRCACRHHWSSGRCRARCASGTRSTPALRPRRCARRVTGVVELMEGPCGSATRVLPGSERAPRARRAACGIRGDPQHRRRGSAGPSDR